MRSLKESETYEQTGSIESMGSAEPLFLSAFIQVHRTLVKLIILAVCVFALVMCWRAGESAELALAHYTGIPESNTSPEMEENFSRIMPTALDMQTESGIFSNIDLNDYTDECLITSEGNYLLSGELNGCLRIHSDEQLVHLYFNNVTVTSRDGPAIAADSALKVIITLLPDTENTISDSGYYSDPLMYDSCIYADCDLTFNGSGALNVNGFYKDAIRSKDVVKVLGGIMTVKCKRTAVRGNDGIHVAGGEMYISSEKYGFKTTKSGAEGRGDVMISGGTHSVIAGMYAFVCTRGDLYIYNCTVYNRSIVSAYDVSGAVMIERGSLL